jgi:hypothetical protein
VRFNKTKINKMSKRCKLQKEYYKEFGNYKGEGKYSDHYVKWLENEVLALRLYNVVGRSEQLKCQCKKAQFTRTVDAEFNPLCGRCGKAL